MQRSDIMRIYDNGTYRDMTPKEIAEWEKSQAEQIEPVPDELTTEDITEILAEQDYRLCLLELGVNIYDL